ncbi:MAG TPA: hypothetical protein VEA69_25480 [Tepidisphaeraceae bacterium]|nr:hypothetical protein [Tepidisphaeraceae bacterium]
MEESLEDTIKAVFQSIAELQGRQHELQRQLCDIIAVLGATVPPRHARVDRAPQWLADRDGYPVP